MEERKTNKKINYSFELLRLILALWVVFHHCCKNVGKFRGRFHIPTFMIMSFYFYYNTLKEHNIIKIKQRFQRISIPYIIWPTSTLIINNILFKCLGFSQFNKNMHLKDLVLQLVFGFHYHNVFYYQFNLIIITMIFSIVSLLFAKYFTFIFQLFLILAYIFQYGNWSLYILKKYSKIINYSLGNFFELLPFAVTGVTFHHLDVIPKLKNYKKLTIFFVIVVIFLILKYDIFTTIRGYYYPGIFLNIGGICIFILFSLFSFKNKKIILFLKIITKFTGGIYYIHKNLYAILRRKFTFLFNETFHGSILIYLICYIICYFGDKLTYKTKLKFLFN